MNKSRVWQSLTVVAFGLAVLSTSCTPENGGGRHGMHARTRDPNDPVYSNPGGNPRKGTPTPIVVNAVLPTSNGTGWSRAVAWSLLDDDSADNLTCYEVEFHFYKIDLSTHAITLRDDLFTATLTASTECPKENMYHVDEEFVVTIARRSGGSAPAAGGTYLLVGTCKDPNANVPAAANKGSGAYLFQFSSK